MSEELPPIWALDKAAKAAGWHGWSAAVSGHIAWDCKCSIIAHARTIAQYEQPPVDEDEEALLRILSLWMENDEERNWDKLYPDAWSAALAQFKRELEARK